MPGIMNSPENLNTNDKMNLIKTKKKIKTKKHKKRSTKNERKILLQQQHLKREVKMSTRNIMNFRDKWREIMMKVQIPRLKQDVIITKSLFDRALDIKKYQIQLNVENLGKCEIQHQRNVSKHMESIDKFITIYHNRLNAENNFYQDNFTSLINDYTSEIEKIKFIHNEDEIMIQIMIYEGKRRIQLLLDNTSNDNAFKLENLRNNGENLTKIAVLHLEEKLSSIWKYLDKLISNYLNATEYRRLLYEELKANDSLDREIIAHQLIRTDELSKSIQQFKNKILKLNEDTDKITVVIASKKYQLQNAYQLLIEKFNNDKNIDKNQLNIFTINYNITIKYLQYLVKRAREILFLIRRYRKFQLQSEKILPVRRDHVNEQANILDILWYRVGTAQVLTNKLKRDREILMREKNRLYECVKCRMINK